MNQEQLPVQVFGLVHRRTLPITIRIVRRRLHVALGVNGIIVAPIRNCAAGNSNLESLAVCQRVTRHKSAIAPPPETYARTINIGLLLEPRKSILQIAQLQLTEILIERPGGAHALVTGRAVVADPDDIALLCQHLMPKVTGAAPGIPDR